MKKCQNCKEVKRNSDFPKDKKRKDGLYKYCKACKEKLEHTSQKKIKKPSKTKTIKPAKKKCSGCEKTKPVAEFSKDRTKKDGLYHLCKTCRSAYRQKKKENKESKKHERPKKPAVIQPSRKNNQIRPGLSVNKEGTIPTCSFCGEMLPDYIPGYQQGQPLCKSCVILNLREYIKNSRSD